MYNVSCNIAKNRMYFTLAGYMGPEQLTRAVDVLVEAAKIMNAGFDVIADVSELQSPANSRLQGVQRARTGLRRYGLRRLVRVVADPSHVLLSYRLAMQDGITVVTAYSRQAAESLLDEVDACHVGTPISNVA
jgi:hypothetical protein